MPHFDYEALDKGGKQIRGSVAAGSEEAILERLRNMGYYPIEVKMSRNRTVLNGDISAIPGLRQLFHRITNNHLMTFTRQFATLLDAGLPMLRALSILEEQVDSVIFKEKIRRIASDIEAGSTLSNALAKHPKVFDSLYVNMVRAGEMGGALEAVLTRVAEFLEKRQTIVGKVRSALMYPAVVVSIALAIVSFILIWIVPQFETIYAQLNAELPAPTRFLVHAGYILAHQTWVIALVVVGLWFVYRKINRTKEGKYVLDLLKMKLPVLGQVLRKSAIVRFCGTLATLITSGVPILQALDIVRETSGNEVVTRAVDKIYHSVRDGDTIHEPLSTCKVFPPLVVHMVAVGEETGAIDQMLRKVSEAYERDVDNTVNALTSIIEPLLIVFLGVIIGAVVIALYLPLIGLATVVGKE